MLGLSFGEILFTLGGIAALLGPKDLPIIARTVGRLAGRSIGYVQLARGQFSNVMEQSQANQVHKELKETIAQLEAIRHEVRSISIMNPGPLTRRLVDNPEFKPSNTGNNVSSELVEDQTPLEPISSVPESGATTSTATNLHGQATTLTAINLHSQASAYAKLAESQLKNVVVKSEKLGEETDLLNVLPVSAESAGLLPTRKDDANGSDIMLEAVLEAEMIDHWVSTLMERYGVWPTERQYRQLLGVDTD
ncbi:hypothetical protein FRX31_025394 [Thalictrum thalictroides]|uniref:Uncharacterized protein n=1 Tax=Thalictrum thalictroides TaxID=46969 RepID=A0A7J6VK75_THATH|nr:hypothetical protein FRX31_025394 [Thalictrum thalictroides]